MSGGPVSVDHFTRVFAEFFDRTVEELPPTQPLGELAFDSVEMLEVLLFLEDVADHEVPEELVRPSMTVQDVYDLYVTYLGHSG